MRRRHGGRRARVRGKPKVAADFSLLAAAVNLARLGVLGAVAEQADRHGRSHQHDRKRPARQQTPHQSEQPPQPAGRSTLTGRNHHHANTSRHSKHNRSAVTTYPTKPVRHHPPRRPRASQLRGR